MSDDLGPVPNAPGIEYRWRPGKDDPRRMAVTVTLAELRAPVVAVVLLLLLAACIAGAVMSDDVWYAVVGVLFLIFIVFLVYRSTYQQLSATVVPGATVGTGFNDSAMLIETPHTRAVIPYSKVHSISKVGKVVIVKAPSAQTPTVALPVDVAPTEAIAKVKRAGAGGAPPRSHPGA